MRPRPAAGLVLVGLVAYAASCADPDREIARVLDQALGSIPRSDASGFLQAFSPGYQDEFFPLAQARGKIIARLASPPALSAGLLNRTIEREGDRALVQQEFILEGVLADRPRRYREVEHLRLEKTLQGWVIVAGSDLYQLLAGRVEEEDRIGKVLDQRGQALEKGDLSLYLAVVSPFYEERGQGPEAIRKKVTGIFESFQNLRYRVLTRQVRFNGNRAVVEQSFRLEADLEGRRRTFEDRERLELDREAGEWKIVGGL